LGTNGIKELIEILKNINGTNVWIHIKHDLYGDQNLKCAFQLLSDEERLGFFLGEQEIYIEKNRIKNIGAQDNLFYFADDLMCIKIRKM
jgi:hypothetical protein